jgi:hypothetical protein
MGPAIQRTGNSQAISARSRLTATASVSRIPIPVETKHPRAAAHEAAPSVWWRNHLARTNATIGQVGKAIADNTWKS